jgi:hypothetical protein
MAFAGGGRWDADDPTPWERARVPLAVWEKAVDAATIEYEAVVRRVAEIYQQRNLAAWRDGREMTSLARRRVAAVLRGDEDAVGRMLRERRSWAG